MFTMNRHQRSMAAMRSHLNSSFLGPFLVSLRPPLFDLFRRGLPIRHRPHASKQAAPLEKEIPAMISTPQVQNQRRSE